MKTPLSEATVFKRNKWAYSIPGIGRDMAYTLFATYVLTYVLFTRSVTTEQFATLGIILAIFRVWDALNDPVMGGIVENTRGRFGKFKPWIMIGAVTNGVVLVAMFTNRVEGWAFVWLFAVLYLLWDITWTMNDIAYWSMLPSLTSDPKRRDSVTSLANLFGGIGAIAATGLIPIFTNGTNAIGGNSISGYIAVVIFIASALVISQIIVCACVKQDNTSRSEKEANVGLKKMFHVIFHNDQLLWVTLIMLLYNLGSTLITAFGVNYMYLSFGYDGFLVTLFVAFWAIASIAINALYPTFAAKRNRKTLSKLAVIMTTVGYAMFFLGGTLIPNTDALRVLNIGLLCLEAFIIGFGQSLFYMVTTICLTNTIEYNQYKTGERDEAIIFSLRPFMAKMGSALQQVVITVVYIAIGMTTLTNGISEVEKNANLQLIDETAKTDQIAALLNAAPGSMVLWLRICMTLLPIILIGCAYLVMRKRVKIDENEYKRMLTEIEEREKI
ncbi:MAG TPA: glycoside-pentoside-hexuronide (GPH):cation symporter [Oscillospiraceae bacterium]|nr:glycoside-pentoside-hexuronide (GPH):cation symporter [Oscillospiraceae bacterium]HPK36360.1 glycoside-pentoside-hexuronide (GPH):cation symporter [Oscillospiraceae bacterium]HPR76866.1 glycoside-pentoside-hexuronide (GPH):cation symporter [Oscillospiraceae bacterium]